MRAFLMAIVAIIVISFVADVALTSLDLSAERVFQTESVRTDG